MPATRATTIPHPPVPAILRREEALARAVGAELEWPSPGFI